MAPHHKIVHKKHEKFSKASSFEENALESSQNDTKIFEHTSQLYWQRLTDKQFRKQFNRKQIFLLQARFILIANVL